MGILLRSAAWIYTRLTESEKKSEKFQKEIQKGLRKYLPHIEDSHRSGNMKMKTQNVGGAADVPRQQHSAAPRQLWTRPPFMGENGTPFEGAPLAELRQKLK